MRYLLLLLLTGCAVNIEIPKKVEVEDVTVKHEFNVKLNDPILQTCLYNLQKTDIDEQVINCYYETVNELKNKYKKDYQDGCTENY